MSSNTNNNVSLVKKSFNSCFPDSDQKKTLEDFQTILDVVLTVIICLGSSNIVPPTVMGSTVISVVALKAIVGALTFRKEKRKPEDISAIAISIFFGIGLAATVALSILLMTGQMDGNIFSIYALGVDLTTIFVRAISQRICGPSKKRYTFCQK